MTYNTGNPLGSSDPRDLYDNAENLDSAVNDLGSDTWTDRLGRSRKTMSGMERQFDADQASREQQFSTFIASSGYQFAGDYDAGIEITQYNQLVRDGNGEFWRVSGQVDLPYTTTGSGLPEGGAFVAVGDAALRQELANPDKGAAMVGYHSSTTGHALDLLNAKFFRTVQELLSGVLLGRPLSYVGSENSVLVSPGDILSTGTYLYAVAAPDATDNPIETDTGVKLYPMPNSAGFISLKQVGCLGDGVTDDTAARDAAYTYCALTGAPLQIEPGTYVFSTSWTLDATSPFVSIDGAGRQLVTLDFSSMEDGIALVVPGNIEVQGGYLKGFTLRANHSVDGVSLRFWTVGNVKDVLVLSANVGLQAESMWDTNFEVFHTFDCVQSLNLFGQSNNLTFLNSVPGNSQQGNSFTNCENLNFIGCDYSEFLNATAGSLLYQTNINLVGCYFENHGDNYIFGIGSFGEAIPSAVRISGGILNSQYFKVNGAGVDLVIEGPRAGWGKVKVHNAFPDSAPQAWCRRLIVNVTGDPAFQSPPVPMVDASVGRAVTLPGAPTITPGSNTYDLWDNPPNAFLGVTLSSELVIGEQYTLAVAINQITPGTTGSLAIGESGHVPADILNTNPAHFEIRYFPFIASSSTLRIGWNNPVAVNTLKLFRGIPGDLLPVFL